MQSHSIFHQAGKARCRTPWAQMAGSERVRICPHCNTNVYRVSDLSESEISQLIADSEPATRAAGNKLWLRTDGTFMARQAVCLQDYELFGRGYIASIVVACCATMLLLVLFGKEQFYGVAKLSLALILMSAAMIIGAMKLFGEQGKVHLLRERPLLNETTSFQFVKWMPGFWQLPARQREALASKIYRMIFLAVNSAVCLCFYSAIPRGERVFIVPAITIGTWMLALHTWRWCMAQHDACCGSREEIKSLSKR